MRGWFGGWNQFWDRFSLSCPVPDLCTCTMHLRTLVNCLDRELTQFNSFKTILNKHSWNKLLRDSNLHEKIPLKFKSITFIARPQQPGPCGGWSLLILYVGWISNDSHGLKQRTVFVKESTLLFNSITCLTLFNQKMAALFHSSDNWIWLHELWNNLPLWRGFVIDIFATFKKDQTTLFWPVSWL